MQVSELENTFIAHKKKLHIFLSLQKGDKIMENVHEQVLYIEPPGYFQFIKRWWYGEDKKTTFRHLDKYFVEFIRFLDNILTYTRANEKEDIEPLGNKVCGYINRIITGIHVLKYTYPNYKELHDKIASIIITMIDFKEEYRENIRDTKNRGRAISF